LVLFINIIRFIVLQGMCEVFSTALHPLNLSGGQNEQV